MGGEACAGGGSLQRRVTIQASVRDGKGRKMLDHGVGQVEVVSTKVCPAVYSTQHSRVCRKDSLFDEVVEHVRVVANNLRVGFKVLGLDVLLAARAVGHWKIVTVGASS
jgi:hypothetical protein